MVVKSQKKSVSWEGYINHRDDADLWPSGYFIFIYLFKVAIYKANFAKNENNKWLFLSNIYSIKDLSKSHLVKNIIEIKLSIEAWPTIFSKYSGSWSKKDVGWILKRE